MRVYPFQTDHKRDSPVHSVQNKSRISRVLIIVIVSGLLLLAVIGYGAGGSGAGDDADISSISNILQDVLQAEDFNLNKRNFKNRNNG